MYLQRKGTKTWLSEPLPVTATFGHPPYKRPAPLPHFIPHQGRKRSEAVTSYPPVTAL
jgi:hypothetical protein